MKTAWQLIIPNECLTTARHLHDESLTTTWRLHDDCSTPAWQLPANCLTFGWWLSDDYLVLITAWRLPEDCLKTAWWLLDDCLTTSLQLPDYYMMTVWQPEDYFKCWCSITKQIEPSNLPVLFHSKIFFSFFGFHYKKSSGKMFNHEKYWLNWSVRIYNHKMDW